MLNRRTLLVLCWAVIGAAITAPDVEAAVFGEVAASVGGTYPQGTFTRYADPGWVGNVRATIHVPHVEVFAAWVSLSYVEFAREAVKTRRLLYEIEGGPTVYKPVDQTTKETMTAGHIGLQLATLTRHAFFRPRVALGMGVYYFRNDVEWTEEGVDSTVTLATVELDEQTVFGWRLLLGSDLFITTRIGLTAEFVYDHVFDLNQTDGPSYDADLTSRFHGFNVGVVYMFEAD
ncbi:MAG TPA: outer membrane beta-barrel protein [Candidatus Deferrimicrobium sp.]|nr:outer membrane beta-barrel protein [Candidatus Deferrimicrobium sp.]